MSGSVGLVSASSFLAGADRCLHVLMIALVLFLCTHPVFAETRKGPENSSPPGTNVEELLKLAQNLNQEVKAAAMESEAASARADAAGRLADPNFTVFSDQNQNRNGGVVPSRFGNWTFTVQQVFPLGGKRSLQHEVAAQEAKAAEHEQRAVADDLNERVKTVYGEYYQITQAQKLAQEVRDSVVDLLKVAEKRYAQSIGEQQDVLKAELERNNLEISLARLESDQLKVKARLNALVNRAPNTPLASPSQIIFPDSRKLNYEALLGRVQGANAMLAAAEQRAASAVTNEDLVSRNWYPDLTAGFGVVDNRPMDETAYSGASYEAMLSINIPLSWGLKKAQEHEARAKAGAARAKRETVKIQTQSDLHQAISTFTQLEKITRLLQNNTIPTAKVTLRSTITAYGLGRGDYRSAIEAHHILFDARTELIKTTAEQNVQLAIIERLIGGPL
jgi:cobalt-zinc-cadmium efflux system outer membrane protein